MSRFRRKLDTQKPRSVVRIYTEGEVTEPNYFESIKEELRRMEIDIIDINGTGDHTLPLVDLVIEKKEKEERVKDGYETEWWVVLDRDDHEYFDKSIIKAKNNGINVAYSNECFELWFILHFELLQSSLGRKNFEPKLTKLLGKKYEKNMDIYGLIKDKEKDAIRNAKKLEEIYNNNNIENFTKRDPSTTVYALVEMLRSLKSK